MGVLLCLLVLLCSEAQSDTLFPRQIAGAGEQSGIHHFKWPMHTKPHIVNNSNRERTYMIITACNVTNRNCSLTSLTLMSSFLSTEAVTSTQNNDVYFIFHMNLIWDPNSCVDNHSIKAKKKKMRPDPHFPVLAASHCSLREIW